MKVEWVGYYVCLASDSRIKEIMVTQKIKHLPGMGSHTLTKLHIFGVISDYKMFLIMRGKNKLFYT